MELRSGRRLRHSPPPPPPPPHGTRSHPMDLISALPYEMLLLVLARLRCVRTAAQTSLLSRRWRGLWIGLTDLTFRGLAPATIKAAFCRLLSASPRAVSTLDIGITTRQAATGANSLLRAAVRLWPRKLLLTFEDSHCLNDIELELPCFWHTTSIELDTRHLGVKPVPAGWFTALEILSITGEIINLGSFLKRCPSLRVLIVSCPHMHLSHKMLPVGEFPALEKLSLSGKIVDPGPLLSNCQRLRELSVKQSDTRPLHITVPPSGEFPVLEKLSLSGKITGLGTLLNRCPRLRVLGVTFTKMALGSLEAALATLDEAVSLGLVLSLLRFDIPWRDDVDAARFASLLATVARLSPQELVMTDNLERCTYRDQIHADLPCFPHTTSVQMSLQIVCFARLPASEFSALENLYLLGRWSIADIGTLVTRCPRLRVLKVTLATGKITVHSSSLQKLDVTHRHSDGYKECHGVDIVAPMLKQLHLDVHAIRDMDVSILAPALEKVLWKRSYTAPLPLVFGSWRLLRMSVQTIDQRSYVQNTCPQVLCLHLYAGNHLDADFNFAKEIEKLPVTNFLVLELNFHTDRAWHVYGALVLQLLRMHRIRAATKKLKVDLPWFPPAKRECVRNCRCDNPENWRSQSILCTSLEEVEIRNYNGEDHEHDFLRLMFKCSPMLKSVTVRPSATFRGCTTELSNIFSAHPSVKCYR